MSTNKKMAIPSCVPKRLNSNFNAMKALANLMNASDAISPELIKSFAHMLNNTIPVGDNEKCQWEMTRFFYYRNKTYFFNMVRKNDAAATLLWTEPAAMLAYFKLNRKLYIRWDRKTEKFSVTMHNAIKSQDDDEQIVFNPKNKKTRDENVFAVLKEDSDEDEKEEPTDKSTKKKNITPPKLKEENESDADSEDVEVAAEPAVESEKSPTDK